MNIIKLNNGKIELRKESGSLIRTIGTGNYVDADLNEGGTLIIAITETGKAELRKESGSLVRTLGSGNAIGAKFHGEDILISTNKSKSELRKESGTLIKTY